MTDYENLKKKYGENFAKFCRDTFSSILEEEGLLSKIIEDKFAPSKVLFDDIVKAGKQADFSAYIFSLIPKDKVKTKQEKNIPSPEELFKKAGYTLYKCETNDDVLSFKKYWTEREELCTFRDRYRIDNFHIFFAVKDNVEDIKRENFKKPERQDEYGTSVISLQFHKSDSGYLSIKNRYNHTVNNPDATFSNNLENIVPGLTQSFEKYYGSKVKYSTSDFELGNYVLSKTGKMYKYNMEIDNVYYCANNIIIKNGEVKHLDKNRYELVDFYLIDKQEKTLISLSNHPNVNADPFLTYHDNIQKLEITKIKNKQRLFTLTLKNGEVAKITVDENNRMVGYENNDITNIKDNFLFWNWHLKKFTARNLITVGDGFLEENEVLEEINVPRLQRVGDGFLRYTEIEKLHLPSLKTAGFFFVQHGSNLTSLNAPLLQEVENGFLEGNTKMLELNLPSLKTVGSDFLCNNEALCKINLPVLKFADTYFLYFNKALKVLNLPNLKKIEYGFLEKNSELEVLNVPSVTEISDNILLCNQNLKLLNIKNVQKIGNGFLYYNRDLTVFYAPSLKTIGDGLLKRNERLTEFTAPKLETIGDGFLEVNTKLKNFDLPSLTQVEQTYDNLWLDKNPKAKFKVKRTIKKNIKNKQKELEG